MIPLLFDFLATPPAITCTRLLAGPGEAPMLAAAAAYTDMAHSLSAAAAGSDGSTNSLSVSYRGPSSDLAQQAFRAHASWLREQAVVAARAASSAALVAQAYAVARTQAAALLPAIIANRVAFVGLNVTNTMAQNTPAIAANEVAYAALWAHAAAVMTAYASQVVGTVSTLPVPKVAPTIVSPIGAGTLPSAPRTVDLGSGTVNVGDLDFGANGTADSITDTTQRTAEDLVQQVTDPASDALQQGADQGNADPLAQQSLSDNAAPSSTDPSAADPGLDSDASGFYGTSPDSPTLAGLNGGAGSAVALGMIRGGFGAMSGVATGFRLPTSWNGGGVGTAFGALSPSASSTPMMSSTAPRGATAPAGQLLRRRDNESRRPGKVFVPGEQQDIPSLEWTPAIGVIEYSDGDDSDESSSAESVVVGVLLQDDNATYSA